MERYIATQFYKADSPESRILGESGLVPSEFVLAADAQRALDAERRERHAVEQIAGQALGYPWFKDDQKNFPGATEADGVCIGEHVAGTIVQELASKLATLQAQLAQPIHICQRCGRVGRDGWVTARYECDELHGSLQCPDCQCIDLETNTAKELAALCTQAQAQLRHVEGENELLKSGQRYMALEKERDTLRQLVEEAEELYTHYGLIANPGYAGPVNIFEWIGKVRAALGAKKEAGNG